MSDSKEPRSEFVEGVLIASRHGIDSELLRMRRVVESMPQEVRDKIHRFFVDSKTGTYFLEISSPDSAHEIAPYLTRLQTTHIGFDCGRERVLEINRDLAA